MSAGVAASPPASADGVAVRTLDGVFVDPASPLVLVIGALAGPIVGEMFFKKIERA